MDTLFFIASKLVGALIRVDTWMIIAVGLIALATLLKWQGLARLMSLVTLVAMLAIAILPLGDPLLQIAERTYPADPALSQVDGIIVLGGGEDADGTAYWQQTQLGEGAERLTTALALARRFPQARVLFTGGSGRLRHLGGSSTPEAGAAAQFFVAQGLAPDRLLLEGASRNTAENARLSLALAQPQDGETWLLVTSAFHMPRAMRSFASAGWVGLVPYPVDYRTRGFMDGIGWNLSGNLNVLNTAVKEIVGQMAYALTGR